MQEHHIHQTGTLDLDGSNPLECGQQIAEKIVTPLLADVLFPFDQEGRLLLLSGLICSLSGAMAASVSLDAARAILQEADRVLARMGDSLPGASAAAKGLH